MIRRAYAWMEQKVYSPYASFILAFFFFIEAVCFFPADPLLVVYCMERPNRSFFYVILATISSTLGGLVMYALAAWLWYYAGQEIIHHWLINKIISPTNFIYLCTQYKAHQSLAILIAGCMPIPFKAITFTAGFCRLSLIPFIICTAIIRGGRFTLLATASAVWGRHIKRIIGQNLRVVALSSAVITLAIIWWFYR